LADGLGGSLPQDTAAWPQIDGNDVLKRGLAFDRDLPDEPTIPGAIVHYDIVHVHRVKLDGGYAADPIFAILDRADRVTLCDIRPSQDRLFEQFQERLDKQQQRRGRWRSLWKTWVHAPLRAARLRLRGESHLLKSDIYRSPEWLDWCYGQWDEFIAERKATQGNLTLLTLRPTGARPGDASFRLASAPVRDR
jgi:hypothetical protein